MGVVERVLPGARFATLAEYTKQGGGKGIEAARELGPAGILDEVDASGLARPRWRRVPRRSEVAHGRGQRRPGYAVERRGERSRRRARLLQGPGNPRSEPLCGARGCRHRGAGDRRDRGHRRDQAHVCRRHQAHRRGDLRDRRRRLGQRHRDRDHRGTDRVPLRRRDGAARGDRWTAAVSARRAALPTWRRGADRDRKRGRRCERRRARARRSGIRERRPADAGKQRRDLRQRAGHPRQRRRLVSFRRHARLARHDRVHDQRPHAATRRRRDGLSERRCARSSTASVADPKQATRSLPSCPASRMRL